jgi:hypothetical protein
MLYATVCQRVNVDPSKIDLVGGFNTSETY